MGLFVTQVLSLVTLCIIFGTLGVESRDRLTLGQKNGHPIYQFASRLINQVAEERGSKGNQQNILISPFSIRTALAIVYLGAKGQTSDEIQRALQLPLNRDELIQNLARQINTTASSKSSEFKIGNGLFLDKSTHLNEQFVKTLQDQLGSTVQKLDFKSNPSSASSTVNSWISQITKGFIKELVSPSSISPSTSLLLANALFYSGQWNTPLTVLPGKGSFKIDSRTEVKVKMMGTEGTFGFSFIPELGCTGISLPFKDDRFEFVILKPEEGQSIDSVRPLLLNYPMEQLVHKLNEHLRTVTLTMPKFTLKANYDTVNILKKLGISSLFDPRSSDLSGLTSSSKNVKEDRIVLSRMIHQTLLDVNELGATAAAGTTLTGYPISSSSTLNIDSPFLFLLNDRLTGPVLIGQLVNPN